MTYEAAALGVRLDKEQKLEVVELFAKLRDVPKVAIKLDLPIKLVRKTLNDPKFKDYSKTLIRTVVGAEFYGEGLQVALEIMRDSKAKSNERMQALKLIHSVLEEPAPKEQKAKVEEDESLSFSQLVAQAAEDK